MENPKWTSINNTNFWQRKHLFTTVSKFEKKVIEMEETIKNVRKDFNEFKNKTTDKTSATHLSLIDNNCNQICRYDLRKKLLKDLEEFKDKTTDSLFNYNDELIVFVINGIEFSFYSD
ncbi:hypothetical protein BpHYR1_030684 [Brachionus plicatilis]|uniref:Uncharacterized protein n=1 Tax=Brachionus plicatilis TaxID=10195 RepID=A0A3M7PT41_BRAPC|nr:hypothetical protein BpHYR1_030684 [Brachionus plicatilis]